MAVNAPEAGTIKEFLVKEEDTVTVGQDLVKIELGGEPKEGGESAPAKQDIKAPASENQPTSSDPHPSKQESKPQQQSPPPSPPPQQHKSEPPRREPPREPSRKETPPPSYSEAQKSESKPSTTEGPWGTREERRVWPLDDTASNWGLTD